MTTAVCRRADAERILRFFEQFVGTCHHAQEETAPFPRLTLREDGIALVSALMRQHECERESLGLVADALRRLQQGDEGAPDALNSIERAAIAATGRERYNQLVSDYSDIASTWGHWPDARGPEPRRLPGHGRA